MKLRQVTWGIHELACITEFTVGKELTVGQEFTVEQVQRATHSACVTYGAAAKVRQVTWGIHELACVTEFTVGKRVHGQKRVHSTIEKEQV